MPPSDTSSPSPRTPSTSPLVSMPARTAATREMMDKSDSRTFPPASQLPQLADPVLYDGNSPVPADITSAFPPAPAAYPIPAMAGFLRTIDAGLLSTPAYSNINSDKLGMKRDYAQFQDYPGSVATTATPELGSPFQESEARPTPGLSESSPFFETTIGNKKQRLNQSKPPFQRISTTVRQRAISSGNDKLPPANHLLNQGPVRLAKAADKSSQRSVSEGTPRRSAELAEAKRWHEEFCRVTRQHAELFKQHETLKQDNERLRGENGQLKLDVQYCFSLNHWIRPIQEYARAITILPGGPVQSHNTAPSLPAVHQQPPIALPPLPQPQLELPYFNYTVAASQTAPNPFHAYAQDQNVMLGGGNRSWSFTTNGMPIFAPSLPDSMYCATTVEPNNLQAVQYSSFTKRRSDTRLHP